MINNIHHTIQEFALNDSIHLILFFTLLSSFYFYYVTQEEEDAQLHLVKRLLRLDPDNKNNTLINDIISNIVTNYPHILDNLKENSNIIIGGDFSIIPAAEDVHNPKSYENDALFRLEIRKRFREIIKTRWGYFH